MNVRIQVCDNPLELVVLGVGTIEVASSERKSKSPRKGALKPFRSRILFAKASD